ncbi:hypothetical protein AB1Y20_018006 [Prymnesium parvum]|uniref:JmjC domain-containing protein n=1 Tax=Prymnesium parvum TaxID=97485 RepID=A0AB34JQ05_PRYPA|mmetsp:Transcript_7795/g.18741  ORF Transcript_7795/g.18741 Transcript_7795/m.18741 type:complete len:267 (+) Transcript_7795:23-823(+)
MASCSVPIEPADLPHIRFHSEYQRRRRPVVIRNATRVSGERFRKLTEVEELVRSWGSRTVTLSSANAFSYGRARMTIADYLSTMSESSWDGKDADNKYYWFGEHGPELEELLAQYALPRFASIAVETLASSPVCPANEEQQGVGACLHRTSISIAAVPAQTGPSQPPALSFGVAPHKSGVPFHFHNDGFSEVMHGAKRWLLYEDKPPGFQENSTSTWWLEHVYPRLASKNMPYDCIIFPGDLLYFPNGWWHATINIGLTVFMSVFL